MNTTKLKAYAPAARTAFIEAVTRRAGVLGIREDRVEDATEAGDIALIGGQPFPRSIVPLRKELLERIRVDGFAQVMEAMAYTWFNRFVALRFMELHGYFDHGYRVLSDPDGGSAPEILQKAEHVTLSGLGRKEVIRLKLAGNQDEELYRLLLIAQCEELSRVLPDIFSLLDRATILLLPDNLLHSDSLIRQLVSGSDEADWEQVEVLGWIYQFYIADRKDEVMGRKSAVPKEDIPAVTQLFTPHWIVRYLVENSLGRLWLLNRPGSRLREHMAYYIEGEQETDFLKITKPEDIRLCDPAVGSGHMLTYAFDLLYLIYEEEGYAPGDIPALILRHNLCGLEICPRAAQLAEMALVFKAREKFRRFFEKELFVRPNIVELRDVHFAENELRDYIKALGLGDLFNQPMLKLLHQFEEAKNFGSLIQPCLDERAIGFARRAIEYRDLGGQLFLRETHSKVLRVLEQAEALTQRYHVVVANPPYMGKGALNAQLLTFGDKEFPDAWFDLYSMFIHRSLQLVPPHGLVAMVTMQSWMFAPSYEDFRKLFLNQHSILSLVHLGPRAFDTISGEIVSTCAFTVSRNPSPDRRPVFVRVVEQRNEAEKEKAILAGGGRIENLRQREFFALPGQPIAYWVSRGIAAIFKDCDTLERLGKPRSGLTTGNNPLYLRLWHEVGQFNTNITDINYPPETVDNWLPLNGGSEYRKWYGSNTHLIYWKNNGAAIRGNPGATMANPVFQFKAGVTWSKIAGNSLAVRLTGTGFIFSAVGLKSFPDTELLRYITGFLNSSVVGYLVPIFSSNITILSGDLAKLPLLVVNKDSVDAVIEDAVSVARADWDNFETSWDFRDQPLLRSGLKGATMEASWRNWEAQSTAAIRQMQELETENNRLFIAAYGLEGELQPEVPEEQITLARADAKKDMAAFLSYAVGCMMGRYSVDQAGLILADAGGSLQDFLAKVPTPSFVPDEDGIIPVLDGEWFEDDIVARSREFLRTTFGEDTLNENLEFLKHSLGKDLRTYFLNDFGKDHLQTYKNRPIYWLFSSGKEKAFQCLVYLHCYHIGTLARMRTEYVIPLQGKLNARIAHLEEEKAHATTSAQGKKLQTEQDKLKKQQTELIKFDEQLRHYADQKITLDLDDGVKVNYAKFGPLVAESKKVCGTKEE